MKLPLLSLLILGVILVGSEAYCPCRTSCKIKKVYLRPQCCPSRVHYVYVTVCIKHGYCYGKRSMEPEIDIGFPCDFSKYDTDKDGKISKEELLVTLRMKQNQVGDLKRPFEDVDKNGDGGIDCGEFKTSKFEFKCEPTGCKHA